MTLIKALITTGARLVEDVLLLADCQVCYDEGHVEVMKEGRPTGYYQVCLCQIL